MSGSNNDDSVNWKQLERGLTHFDFASYKRNALRPIDRLVHRVDMNEPETEDVRFRFRDWISNDHPPIAGVPHAHALTHGL